LASDSHDKIWPGSPAGQAPATSQNYRVTPFFAGFTPFPPPVHSVTNCQTVPPCHGRRAFWYPFYGVGTGSFLRTIFFSGARSPPNGSIGGRRSSFHRGCVSFFPPLLPAPGSDRAFSLHPFCRGPGSFSRWTCTPSMAAGERRSLFPVVSACGSWFPRKAAGRLGFAQRLPDIAKEPRATLREPSFFFFPALPPQTSFLDEKKSFFPGSRVRALRETCSGGKAL